MLYRWNGASPARRSPVLYSMLFSQIFVWTLLGASLVFCTAFLNQYSETNHGIVRVVFGYSLLASLGASGAMTVTARRFALPKALDQMIEEPNQLSSLKPVFERLSTQMGVTAELEEAAEGNAFSISLGRHHVVALSSEMVKSLSAEEVEAVLAHELSHIKNRDSLAKGLARLAHLAFPFDPIVRLVEAAIHRERELLADSVSVMSTKRPLALASALLKACRTPISQVHGLSAGLCVGGSRKGLLSLYPDLERRVDILLNLGRQMEISEALIVVA